ncbi:MAG: hypothetical protein RLZ67_171, partial [Actinomycetota bacterium]
MSSSKVDAYVSAINEIANAEGVLPQV